MPAVLPLEEGALYIVRDGELKLIEQDPNDESSKVRITAEASAAVRKSRAIATKHLRWRPEPLVVASAILEHYSQHDQVVEALDAWFARRAAAKQSDR